MITGKELKAYVVGLSDDGVIECQEYGYSSWKQEFDLRAIVRFSQQIKLMEEDPQ